MLTAGSLFSGYGGLSSAVEDALGARTAWVSDIDPAACKVLARRFPDVPNLGDITTIDWATVPPVDIIEGGSPCQDVSMAGRRAGMTDGTRSNLWVAMREAIAVIKPTYVIWENVHGVLSANAASNLEPCPGCMGDPADGGVVLRALGRVLGDLADLGFDAEWISLRASDVGACHRRNRVFVFAWHPLRLNTQGKRSSGVTVTSASTGARLPVGPSVDAGLTPLPPGALVFDTPDTMPEAPNSGSNRRTQPAGLGNQVKSLSTLPTPTVTDRGRDHTPDEWDEWTTAMKAKHGNGNGHGPSLAVEARRATLPTPRTSDTNGAGEHGNGGPDLRTTITQLPTPRATDGTKGGPNQRGSSGDAMLPSAVAQLPTPKADWGKYADAIHRHEQALGRPAPSPTITGARGNPKLSGEFTEWMMMLPHGWIWELVEDGTISNNDALRLSGNGVVPPQAGAAIRAMWHRAFGMGAAA